MQTSRYNSGEGTIKEIDGSDNEVSVYDNVPRSNSGGSRRFRKNQHQSRHLKPSSPTGSRKSRKSRKSSGGSTIDRIRYFLKENETNNAELLEYFKVLMHVLYDLTELRYSA